VSTVSPWFYRATQCALRVAGLDELVIPTSWFLIVGAVLFTTGTVGVLVRHNPIVIMVCIELMLNAVNLTLVAFSRQLQNIEGQLFALLTMVVAAAEAVIGLAILVEIFRVRSLDDVDDLSELKG
jgi:NADH-quinone oxidoreductase subunit K